jgi:plastocyanin
MRSMRALRDGNSSLVLFAAGGTSLLLILATLACGTVKNPTEPQGVARTVTVSNFQFAPRELTVHPGDTVTWVNQGGFHNVAADDGSFRCAEGCAGTAGDPSAAAWTFTQTFTAVGRRQYYCEVHGGPGGSGMSGVITVEAAP